MSPIHTLPELLLKVAGMANRRGTAEFLGSQGEASLAFCCLEKWATQEIFSWSRLHFSHWLHCYGFISETLHNFSSLMGCWQGWEYACYTYPLKVLEDSQKLQILAGDFDSYAL